MRAKTLLFLLICCAPFLSAQDNDAIVRKVDDHYNHLSSLRAHYTERYSGLGIDRSEEGTLLLKKPGRMRWSYAAPVGKVFVLDGKFAWFYTPGDTQATRVPATGVIERMRLEEVDGAVTEFAFSEILENVPLKDSDFVFVPPAGVTVV